MTYTENAVNATINRLLGAHPDLDASTDGDLDNLDQFHIGGADAVDLLIPGLEITEGDVILDIGSGFGGPARQLARRTGNRVIGIDITPAYVDAARSLTEHAGLQSIVEFHAADVATYRPETQFHAAITMHVQMNVQDKVGWFTQIARILSPGARLAIWEVCQPNRREPVWPMPWSIDGSDSFVVDAGSLRAAVEQAGFRTTEWTNQSDWVKDWIARTRNSGPATGPALPMLLDDGYNRIVNYTTALVRGDLDVWRGSFTKTSTSSSTNA